MLRMEKILFYVNERNNVEANLETAAAMARNSAATLTLVDVIDKLPCELLRLRPSAGMDSQAQLAMEETSEALEGLARRARELGVVTHTRVLTGIPSAALIREVTQGGYGLLMVNAPRKVGVRERVLGGTTQKLIRTCPCPVLVMPPGGVERNGGVLAAVSPELGDETRIASSAAVLGAAAALARARECELRILHCWSLLGESVLMRTAGVHRGQMASLLLGAQRSARMAMEELMRRVDLKGIRYSVQLRKGDPLKLVPEHVNGKRIGILVIGAPERTGIAGLLRWSLAEEILRSVDCPVATVRSSGLPVPVARRAA
ncbi:MAG TPA: universal stress protein [Bryobacteraceae bacterium]|nr:universal stress protein [Bryobacteraceae bacterium]